MDVIYTTTYPFDRITAHTPNDSRQSVTVTGDPSLSPDQNRDKAAETLARQLGLLGRWHRGNAGDKYIYVRSSDGDATFDVR